MTKIWALFFFSIIFAKTDRIEELLKIKKITDHNIKALEEEYQTLIQPITFEALLKLYDPANEKNVKITYTSFTAESKEGEVVKLNEDLGVGLHVVRRFENIETNEQWPENKRTHNLYLPDSIRIKVKLPSNQVYFDMVRITWNENKEPSIYRRSQYVIDEKTKYNRQIQSKVPVSAPYSCIRCHKGATFSYFQQLDKTPGYKNYIEHLQNNNVEKAFIEKVKAKLLKPAETFHIPHLKSALRHHLDKKIFNWLSEDSSLKGISYNWNEQGIYFNKRKEPYLDALETIHLGKYVWWVPAEVF